jgi:F1F0 ATPase subunit 2
MLSLFTAAVIGFLLGILYFLGLWYTLQKLPQNGHPTLIIITSFLVRLAILLGGLFWVTQGDALRLGVALLGLLAGRMFIMHRLYPG